MLLTLCSPVVDQPDFFRHAEGDEVADAQYSKHSSEESEGGRLVFEASRMRLKRRD